MADREAYVAHVVTYTNGTSKGIHIYDVDVEEGLLYLRKVVPVHNSSYITRSRNMKYLYSIADEGVRAFRIMPDGDLKAINEIDINGMRGCHMSVDNDRKYLFVAGYHDGKVTVVHTHKDGRLGNLMDGVFHKGIGAVNERSFRPHVCCVRVTPDNVADKVGEFEARIAQNDIPSDGLVLTLDDIAYGESLGTTAKFPRNSIAFKWADEIKETTLTEVEWSASRTGLINPVAIFEPVELEGTTVRRASVHNISIVKALKLGIGDRITVYKANMIIPQIAENLTGSGSLAIPVECPVCGQPTMIRQDNDTEVLVCPNPDCAAKKIKSFSLFVSRSAMNIDGLSEMTLEKLIAAGLIHTFADIYHLDAHRDVIEEMEGFGKKSCDRLLEAIEKSRETTLPRVLCAVGIPGIGISGARILCSHFGDDLAKIKEAEIEELSGVEGIGPVLAQNVYAYFRESGTAEPFDALIGELHIARAAVEDKPQILAGKTFVITGKVNHFANRDALKALIVSLGGKAAGSVSAKTDYLINNDVTSNSSKNKKARELGIAILSEEDFLAMIGERNG